MLPPETERVWNFLKDRPELEGMVLVGGTALSMHLRHRLSEDLDLACLEETLPTSRIEVLIGAANTAGLEFEPADNEAAMLEFIQGGMNLRDYQQDYLAARKVKVSIFTADAALERVLSKTGERFARIATVPELFKAKAIVSAKRSKSRDWLDLHLLMTKHGYGVEDYRAAFREAGIESQADIGLARLCGGVPQKDDEGYAHLMEAAPSLEEVTSFFIRARDEAEVRAAAEKLKWR